MKKKERGANGYLTSIKWRKTILTAIMLLLALTVFIGGYYISGKTKENLFSVLAVLMMLPVAKGITGLIVLAPFPSTNKALFEEFQELLPEGGILYSDYLCSSPSHLMFADLLLIGGREVILLTCSKPQREGELQTYLRQGLRDRKINYHLQCVSDPEKAKGLVKSISPQERRSPEEEQELTDYLLSLLYR